MVAIDYRFIGQPQAYLRQLTNSFYGQMMRYELRDLQRSASMSPKHPSNPKSGQPDEFREMKDRIAANELRVRDVEAQARLIEARLRLADAQIKLRERYPAAQPPTK